ncbi:4473_t:CDS:2, partial [Dentiscutata heterogama]
MATSISKKYAAIFNIDKKDDDDDSVSTTLTHSSSSLFVSNNFLKKQTTLSQYIGYPLNAFEVPKSFGNHILINATNEVQKTIKDLACDDKISVTIAFDGLSNVVNQELMGIVFIISLGKTLIWGAKDISIERKQKKEMMFRIYNLFEEIKKLDIKANCLTLVTKDDVALDDDLRLPNVIKEELLIEEEFEEEQDDLYNAEIDFLNSDTHPAKNQA